MSSPSKSPSTPVVEIRSGLKTVSDLRARMMGLADQVRQDAVPRVLLLNQTALSIERLAGEWELLVATLRPEVHQLLSIMRAQDGAIQGWPNAPSSRLAKRLNTILASQEQRAGHRLPRRNAPNVILRALIGRWLAGNRPISVLELGKLTGFSYPTLAQAFQRFRDVIIRRSDRSVQLSRFPTTHWHVLVTNATTIRSTRMYRDVSGSPMSPRALASRIEGLNDSRLAIGGALAAQQMLPEIDLIGSPRVDLCVHAQDSHLDLGFVDRINPALEVTDDWPGPCHLALHFVRSADPMWCHDSSSRLANPVEVMLDLHEMGFSEQAEEIRRALEGSEFSRNETAFV